MKTKSMSLVCSMIALSVLFLSIGCPKKPAFPKCNNNKDCRIDASGNSINAVCYMGECVECVNNSDCSDLNQCVNNSCQPICFSDNDCGLSEHCENNICIRDCEGDDECMGDDVCVQGRCMNQAEADYEGEDSFAKCSSISPIYFDFDRSDIKKEHVDTMDAIAKCLDTNKNATVTIEGHTDERGTTSYNMVLGEKRANVVKKDLELRGVAKDRITTISYGETNPAVKESNDNAWQKNRRAEIRLEK